MVALSYIEKSKQILTEEVNKLTNSLSKSDRIVIFGANDIGILIKKILIKKNIVIYAYLDSYSRDKIFDGTLLCNPQTGIEKFSPNVVILASLSQSNTLEKILLNYGYNGEIIKFDKEMIELSPNLYQKCSSKKILNSLYNCHKNKAAVIIGNGKSLVNTSPLLLDKFITFGCNGITLISNFHPTYYFAVDRRIEVRKNEIEKLRSIKIFASTLYDLFSDGIFFPVKYRSLKSMDVTDIYSNGLETNHSVSIIMLQMAYYMGCDPVYLIGMDHDYQYSSDMHELSPKNSVINNEYFHPDYLSLYKNEYLKWDIDSDIVDMEKGFQRVKSLYEKNDRKIFNATDRGRLEIFPRCHFNEIFSSLNIEG
ncbi:MAG: DUF115 domain-containing protein [gamma proteobacterium symbiont of Taylorina sp.]|nr:DUF115 domain-containing protein [gamma proteobacterium symbiont of Taylorina sp.]